MAAGSAAAAAAVVVAARPAAAAAAAVLLLLVPAALAQVLMLLLLLGEGPWFASPDHLLCPQPLAVRPTRNDRSGTDGSTIQGGTMQVSTYSMCLLATGRQAFFCICLLLKATEVLLQHYTFVTRFQLDPVSSKIGPAMPLTGAAGQPRTAVRHNSCAQHHMKGREQLLLPPLLLLLPPRLSWLAAEESSTAHDAAPGVRHTRMAA
jgi:hypothetical protein